MRKVVIKGERCSGTNYLEKLIEINFNEVDYIPLLDWKHSYLNVFNHNINHSENFLTIIIFRNPIDWLKSFYNQPHHILGCSFGVWKKKINFREFLEMNIEQFNDDGLEMFYEKHPFHLRSPENIFELRNWKIENFLNYKNVLKNVYYLKYEDLYDNPEKILFEINQKFFNVDFNFKNWKYYKDTNKIFKPNKYFKVSTNDLSYINDNLDWSLENKIGYFQK